MNDPSHHVTSHPSAKFPTDNDVELSSVELLSVDCALVVGQVARANVFFLRALLKHQGSVIGNRGPRNSHGPGVIVAPGDAIVVRAADAGADRPGTAGHGGGPRDAAEVVDVLGHVEGEGFAAANVAKVATLW